LVFIFVSGQVRGATPGFELNAIEKDKPGSKSTSGNTANWENLGSYHISIKNLSMSGSASNLTLKYHIYVMRDTGQNDLRKAIAHPEKVSGSQTISSIESGKWISVETEPVKLKNSLLTDGGYYFNGARVSRADKIRGIWIQLFSGDAMVGEYLSYPSLKKLGPF
jgi:hypothetical protein